MFPSLVIEPKWHTERRDVKLNDVVMVQDAKPNKRGLDLEYGG